LAICPQVLEGKALRKLVYANWLTFSGLYEIIKK